MAIKIAINWFWRIGRQVYKALLDTNMLDWKVEVVAVNDLVPADNIAYLLKYDTVHWKLNYDVNSKSDDFIVVWPYSFKTLALKVLPEQLPWSELWIDVVIESTGMFNKKDDAEWHIRAWAKRVLITAPSDPDVKTIVMWVNDHEYKWENIVSNASCTTNCLAPLVHVLLNEWIWFEEWLMTTCHSYTGTQPLVDGPSKKAFRDWRSWAMNIIPASTWAAKAVWLVLPQTKWKLTWMAFRVPTADVSVVDLTFKSTKETSLEKINAMFKKASETYLKGILWYTEDEVVSSDFIKDPRSSIYDSKACLQLNSKFFKLISWYDNEWGYSSRVVDLLSLITKSL